MPLVCEILNETAHVTIDGGGQVWGDFWAVPKPKWFE